jgi:subtilisin family serine protease
MRPAVIIFLTVATTLTAAGPAGAAPGVMSKTGSSSGPAQWVPGRVLVQFREGVPRSEADRILARRGALRVGRIKAYGVDVVKVPGGLSVQRAVSRLAADPRVAVAEPDYYRYLAAPDPLFGHLWGLENIAQDHFVSGGGATFFGLPGKVDADSDVTEAWVTQVGSAATVIAVVDSGIDVNHPDLDGNLWTNDDPPGNGDEDLNGKVDDVHGWNFADNNDDLLAPSFRVGFDHGTHVAGIIAAERDNGTGVAGVCPRCNVMVLRFMANTGALPLSAELKAIAYAKAEGAQIMNASFGGPNWSLLERNALRTSRLLVVVAAGNESLDNDVRGFFRRGGNVFRSPSYPAAYDLANILTVAASTHKDEYGYGTRCFALDGDPKRVCAFTNWGHDSVDVAAPGVDILSTVPLNSGDIEGNDYEVFDGTSMAAPHTAGVAGLVKSENPGWTAAQLKAAIMRSVDHPANLGKMPTFLFGSSKAGKFTRTNNGRVNAKRALTASTIAFPKTDGNIGGAVAMAGRKTGSAAWPADVNDVFKHRFHRNRRYEVRLNGLARRDFDLYVYKPGTLEIWQPHRLVGRGISGDADETVRFRASSTGRYFIQVTVWVGGRRLGGSYVLTIKRV